MFVPKDADERPGGIGCPAESGGGAGGTLMAKRRPAERELSKGANEEGTGGRKIGPQCLTPRLMRRPMEVQPKGHECSLEKYRQIRPLVSSTPAK